MYWPCDRLNERVETEAGIGGISHERQETEAVRKGLHKVVRQLCGEEPYGAEAWMKLRPEDFEPFFCADDVCLLESPVVSAGAAPSWVRRAVDELMAEAGRTVTHFLLHIGSSGRALSLDMLSEISQGRRTSLI